MSGSVLLVVRRCGHLDHLGCAEALVVAALVGKRNASYDDGLAWLLARHQEDGTYAVAKPRNTADAIAGSPSAEFSGSLLFVGRPSWRRADRLIFVFILCATLASAGVHLVRTPATERTRKRVVEILLLYFLCVQWGFGAILTAVPHIIVPDTVAGYIGWTPGSPFQVEMGFASLGLGVLGVLCIWLRGTFWLAPAIGRSIFLYGAAYVHLRDIAAHGNLSPGNAGVPLVFDLVIPTIVLGLLVAHVRLGGIQRAA